MNKTLTALIFIISLTCNSQNTRKKTYYYFQNSQITKAEFESLDSRKIYTNKIENDSSFIENIYFHKSIGKLDSIQLKQLTMFLTKTIGSDFNQKKMTMIHLYRKNGDNIYNDSNYSKYWKWIKKHSDEYQSFLIGTKYSQIKPDDKNHIYLDNYDLLESLFFKSSDFEINHLMIKPSGEIYLYFGLNDILNVLDWSV